MTECFCQPYLKCCLLFMQLFSLSTLSQAQPGPDTIYTANIRLSEKIRTRALWHVDRERKGVPGQPDALEMDTIPAILSKKVPPALIPADIYVKFILHNDHDTSDSFYLLPGFFFNKIELYKWKDATGVERLPTDTGALQQPGCRLITVGPHETAVLVAKLRFIKTAINTLDPVLVRPYYVQALLEEFHDSAEERNAATYIISGVLLMMIFYSLAVYLQNGSREFWYYSGYAFSMHLLFFLKAYLHKVPSLFNNYFESYLDFLLQCIATYTYLAFLGTFIQAKRKFPFLHRLLLVQKLSTVLSIAIFTYLRFATDLFSVQNTVEYCIKIIWLLGIITFIVYAVKAGNYLLNYLAFGQFFLLFCGFISLYLIYSVEKFGRGIPAILNDSLFYYELGIALELGFFLMALAVKNKADIVDQAKDRELLQLKTERQELEKQMAVFSAQQQERNRISADMHDELGSGVTAIRLMSEIVKTKMKENTLPEINRISNAANELINKMNAIIWIMKSENDSLQSLLSYLRIHALEFFENTPIHCTVEIPAAFANVELGGEKRRNIFLSVKETLNNVLKHSKASNVTLAFGVSDKLTVTITDNGIGIDLEKVRQFGSGLSNIKKRIEGIEGSYRIENLGGRGTRTIFELPI